MPTEKRTFVVTATRDYQPFPELWHGYESLLSLARAEPLGAHWKCIGALLLLAFSVEGYANTVGEQLFPSTWKTGSDPLERNSWSDKLIVIGAELGVDVDYGRQPWQTIKEVFKARDKLAHARPDNLAPAPVRIRCYEDELDERISDLAKMHWEKLLDEERLGKAGQHVLAALEMLHVAQGHLPISLRVHGGSVMLIQDVEPH